MLQTDVLAEGRSSAMADGGEYIRIHLGRESMNKSTATDIKLERYLLVQQKFMSIKFYLSFC